MNFPYSIVIGHQKILLHGIMESIGVFVSFRYYLFLKARQGDTIVSENRIFIIIAASLGAVIGSRILGSLENPAEWYHSPKPWLYFYSNKTMVGGVLGALASVELMKSLLKETQNSGDLFTYPLILGIIIGRLGCFSAGVYEETYGLPTRMPWGMDLGDGIPRHPVTLYEILYLILTWLLLVVIGRKYTLRSGALFKIFMICYLSFRLALDFIKPGLRYAAGLGTIQLACIAGLLYYGKYIIRPQLLTQES